MNRIIYGLAGKLCNKTDLEFSCNKTVYSDVLATFVSTVLNIKKSMMPLISMMNANLIMRKARKRRTLYI